VVISAAVPAPVTSELASGQRWKWSSTRTVGLMATREVRTFRRKLSSGWLLYPRPREPRSNRRGQTTARSCRQRTWGGVIGCDDAILGPLVVDAADRCQVVNSRITDVRDNGRRCEHARPPAVSTTAGAIVFEKGMRYEKSAVAAISRAV
jgi:hypothetical protein